MLLGATRLPVKVGGLFGCMAAAVLFLQSASGAPLWSEVGPLSIAQAVLLGFLSLPCAAISLQMGERARPRLLWRGASVILMTVCVVQLRDLFLESLPETPSFEYPALAAWSASATALLLLQRLKRRFHRGRAFVLAGFSLQSVALLADFADGGAFGLAPASLRFIGGADELVELVVLASYLIGLTLVAIDTIGDAKTAGFSSQPSIGTLRWAFSPSRAIIDGSLSALHSAGISSSADFLHAAYRHTRWRADCFSLQERALLLAQIVFWPVIVVATSGRCTLANAIAIRRRSGKPVIRQIVEQLTLAFDHSIAPRAYYIFELYLDARRRRVGNYLQRFETKRGVYRLIKREIRAGAEGAAGSLLNDKAEFIDWCRRRSVPVVPYVLVLERGTVVRSSTANEVLPQADLFVKPKKGKGGKGAEVWSWQGNSTYAASNGELLTADALLERFKDLSLKTSLLVQPCVRNHRLLADLDLGALSTVRIVTCLNEMGVIEATNAAMRVARGTGAVIDNFHAGGLAAKVDMRSGLLGRATDLGVNPAVGWWSRHPANGAPIAGRTLPHWPDALEVVRRAHEAFPTRIFIGWDVALLESGWQVIEGNAAPDLDIIQRTHEAPLGNARLGQLLAFHAAAVLRAEKDRQVP